MAEVVLSPERLAQDAEAIQKIDERLGDDGGAMSRTKVKNQLVRDVETRVSESGVHNQIVQHLQSNYSGPELHGAYFKLMDELNTVFRNAADEYVKETVEASKTEVEPISEEESERLSTERQTLVERYAKAYEYLAIFGSDLAELPEPKELGAKTRKSTPRGPQELSLVSWYVDGEAVDGLKEIAEKAGLESARDVRTALKEQGVSTSKGEVPDSIDVTINGHSVTGTKQTEAQAA